MNEQTTSRGAQILTKVRIIGDLLRFLWRQRLWWLYPIIVALLLLTALFVFLSSGSALSPFIYAVF